MTPSGMAIIPEKTVTANEATIRGKIPKSGGSDVGYQYLPRRKSLTETVLKIGSPSLKRNSMIRNKMVMDAVAMMKNIACIDFSVVWRRLAMVLPFVCQALIL